MQTLLSTVQDIYPLSQRSVDVLFSKLEKEDHPKHSLVFEAGRVEKHIYFIEKGIARAFCYRDGKELTFWFGAEGDVLLSYYSYYAQQPGYESMELLEDSVLYRISHSALQSLYEQHLDIANWGRKLAELELLKTEERFIERQFHTAAQRYQHLIDHEPELLRRVPLGHLASYLGITQVSLSRIRAGYR